MNHLSKEYEIKTKMVHEQWLPQKLLFYLGYKLEIVNLKTPSPSPPRPPSSTQKKPWTVHTVSIKSIR